MSDELKPCPFCGFEAFKCHEDGISCSNKSAECSMARETFSLRTWQSRAGESTAHAHGRREGIEECKDRIRKLCEGPFDEYTYKNEPGLMTALGALLILATQSNAFLLSQPKDPK